MILKVARLGNPILRQKAKLVSKTQMASPGFQAFLQDLIDTMHEYDGVGIAAPQVHVPLQVAVVGADHSPRYPKAPKIPLQIFINPKVKPILKRKALDWEGCLSVEGLRGRVPRWQGVQVTAYSPEGKVLCFKASGFFARVIQHEWDHLQGKVFLDRMEGLYSLTYLSEFGRYHRG